MLVVVLATLVLAAIFLLPIFSEQSTVAKSAIATSVYLSNFYFWRYFGENPFGHSGRRIADFYAGLVGDFRSTQKWKRLRRTKHDHHPVHDALGNAEALIRILDGER